MRTRDAGAFPTCGISGIGAFNPTLRTHTRISKTGGIGASIMTSSLILHAALANTGTKTEDEEFFQKLSKHVPVYRFKPTPGVIYASLDWLAIIGNAADIIALGKELWSAYELYIQPRIARDKKSNAQLIVTIEDDNGHFLNLSIGNETGERDVFIEAFSRKVTTLQNEISPDGTVTKATKIEESSHWVRFESEK